MYATTEPSTWVKDLGFTVNMTGPVGHFELAAGKTLFTMYNCHYHAVDGKFSSFQICIPRKMAYVATSCNLTN